MAELLGQQLFKRNLTSTKSPTTQESLPIETKSTDVKFSIKYFLGLLKENFCKLVPECQFIQQYYAHKIGQYHLIVVPYFQKNGQVVQFFAETYLLKNQSKHILRSYLIRILFGKQIIKKNQARDYSIVINFDTGQIKIKTVVKCQFNLYEIVQGTSYINYICKKLLQVYQELIQSYQTNILPIIKNFSEFNYQGFLDSQQNKQIQKTSFNIKIKNIINLLKISTIQTSSIKQKQCYSKTIDYQKKQKEDIIKLQTNIDMTFSGLQKQLNLFGMIHPKKEIKSLKQIGILTSSQKNKYNTFLNDQTFKKKGNSLQYQYVLNCIGVLKVENKKHFINSGATSVIYRTNIRFQYIFSDDPKYWIQFNKNVKNNIIEKSIAIKEAKQRSTVEKIKHENQIIHKMKGGYSIFLLKYYKIQSSQQNQQINQNILIMDFVKGQTLNQYIENQKVSLSLWSQLYLILNIIRGLRFISEYNIVHNDLKPSNILVVRQLFIKIIDFGEAYHPKICKLNFRPGFTLPYTAPQIFKKIIKFSQKIDVFSLGMIMQQVLFNRKLFQINSQSLHKMFKQKTYQDKMFITPDNLQIYGKSQVLEILQLLILKCLSAEEQKRPCLSWIGIIIKSLLDIYIEG